MKNYRSIYFNDERKWKASSKYDDVFQVGVCKAVGYIYADTNGFISKENCIEYNLYDLEKSFVKNGKLTRIVSKIKYDELWVGDPSMIQFILDKNKKILTASDWSCEASVFFEKLTCTKVYHEQCPNMYHVISELFNSWCLWCEEKIWAPDESGKNIPFSLHPYDPENPIPTK